MKRLLFSLIVLSSMLIACKQNTKPGNTKVVSSKPLDSLELALTKVEKTKILPGFAVSIFTKDSLLFQKGFGLSNIKDSLAYQVDNVQIIASITKTLVGVALMKTVNNGLLDLDDDVNDILPFKVSNPNFPNEKITIRMLASHTSSIDGTNKFDSGYRFETKLNPSDFPIAYKPLLDNYNKTEEIPLKEFLKYHFSPTEKWYDKELFTNEKPGTSYEYSNFGIALLAYIIEIKTEKSFDQYTKELILDPLGMSSSTWSLSEVAKDKHVSYYNESFNIVPKYHIITYPDGGLYSSVSDLTIYLQEMMKGYDGQTLYIKNLGNDFLNYVRN